MNLILKLFLTGVAIFLIVFPEPLTTATGLALITVLWIKT